MRTPLASGANLVPSACHGRTCGYCYKSLLLLVFFEAISLVGMTIDNFLTGIQHYCRLKGWKVRGINDDTAGKLLHTENKKGESTLSPEKQKWAGPFEANPFHLLVSRTGIEPVNY